MSFVQGYGIEPYITARCNLWHDSDSLLAQFLIDATMVATVRRL